MRAEVYVDELDIKTVEDLYTNVLIPIDEDPYDGRTMYDTVTVWYCLDDIEVFEDCMEMMTPEELMEFRDEMDGNVLSSLAQSGKPIEFWDLVEDYIGHENFLELLTMEDRAGRCPLTQIKDVDTFADQLNKTLITRDMMRQIALHGTDEVVEYITEITNLFNPNEFMD